jgi:fatty-acyl-CoA synthase
VREEAHLARRAANFRPLSPADFLLRAVESFPDRPAVAWRKRRWTYAGLAGIAGRLGAWLTEAGVGRGDVVSVICGNRPEMLAAHYAVPALGAVLNSINTRLDVDTIAYILDHSDSRVLIADPACLPVAREAAARGNVRLVVLGEAADGVEGLDLLSDEDQSPAFAVTGVVDEWQPLCLNYTSGTTGRPKGVVYHHRGAYLNALGNVSALRFNRDTVYLWTLPMFHCNGWCHTWAVTAAGGLHVCLDRVDPAVIFEAIDAHAVTHFACAPVVLYMLLNHPGAAERGAGRRILVGTGGAAPTATLIEQLGALGIDIIHLYGLTESYGPVTLRVLPDAMETAPASDKAVFLAQQGVSHPTANRVRVVDGEGADVPADGVAMGEVLLAGNTLMAGYYRDEAATEAAFAGGWFHTGDLAVRHPDGSIELRDRSKDIIITGGENVSSLEIESVLHRHPGVLLAAVVAAPDPKWGEVPCAFIEVKAGAVVDAEDLRLFCKAHLAGFKVPRRFLMRELPKTATGKIQKFMLRQEAAMVQP